MGKFNKILKQWLRENDIYFGKKITLSQLDDFFKYVRPFTTDCDLVRIGEKGDGGYLLPDDFDDISVCFSPGVSKEIHFELALAEMGIRSYMADYSVESLPVQNEKLDFEKKFLAMENCSKCITLETWVHEKVGDHVKDMILQMDIEGAEYEIIFDTSNELLRRFRIIVIEFHRLDSLLDRYGYQIINTAFRKLLKNFEIVHIHPNNNSEFIKYKKYRIPSNMEFTFLNKDRITECRYTSSFPHELDSKNMPDKSDIILPECWYR